MSLVPHSALSVHLSDNFCNSLIMTEECYYMVPLSRFTTNLLIFSYLQLTLNTTVRFRQEHQNSLVRSAASISIYILYKIVSVFGVISLIHRQYLRENAGQSFFDNFYLTSFFSASHEGIPTLVVCLKNVADILHHRERYAHHNALII